MAEIDELHWMWMREREAEAMERNAAAQDRRRDAAKARTMPLRTLLKNLGSSVLGLPEFGFVGLGSSEFWFDGSS